MVMNILWSWLFFRVLLRLLERRLEWQKRSNKIAPCQTGLDTRLTIKSDTMPREDTGEEQSSSSEQSMQQSAFQ